MATSGLVSSTKVIRIQDDEKDLLYRLREIYGNDYKKFPLYILSEKHVPLSIKKIYKILDERKAYRRISDYFHRERAAKKLKESQQEIHQQRRQQTESNSTTSSDMLRSTIRQSDINETIGGSLMIPLADTSSRPQQQKDISSNRLDNSLSQHQTMIPDRHQSVLPSELLTIRTHLQQALRIIDNTLIKREYDEDEEDEYLEDNVVDNNNHSSRLDDLVRSLGHVVTQQQQNASSLIDATTSFLVVDEEDGEQNETATTISKAANHNHHQSKEVSSIKSAIDRLNSLVNRGHTIYDRLEAILAEF
ncbi:unnamed protein product [Didymodactylos carnosus]|uniref:Uncharacterized protein n=1 Tax=Didymodactylos carnosus TaxID=1234261 RepID=A0A815CH25_9BILA|nr:unnamed protein product [Didymodactylos carnosus]CAF1283649.1 unnamed protein product [Didymodactylos carnosus]CAF4081191.1 unnamed protein product [Didymodactylos carnosus]CAF4086689.1 unnamed protein product [Didymodactylos carnosus]